MDINTWSNCKCNETFTGYYKFVPCDSGVDRLIKKLEELIDEVKEFNAEKKSK